MIVISDTSPLTNLAAIGQFDLLYKLFGNLLIAESVWSELNAFGKHWPGRNEVEAASWIQRRSASDKALITALQRDLQAGEAESIALALEVNAELILLDEKDGRHVAQQMGLRVLGVVGILIRAKSLGMIEQLQPYLDDLRLQAGFYLSDALYRQTLSVVGEL